MNRPKIVSPVSVSPVSVSAVSVRTVLVSTILDVGCVLAFVAIGRHTHHDGDSVAGIWHTAWPFLAGLAIGLGGVPRQASRAAADHLTGVLHKHALWITQNVTSQDA